MKCVYIPCEVINSIYPIRRNQKYQIHSICNRRKVKARPAFLKCVEALAYRHCGKRDKIVKLLHTCT